MLKQKSQPERKEAPKRPPTKKAFDPRLEGVDLDTTAVVVIEQPNFDAQTGERLSTPYAVTFNEKDWLQFLTFGLGLGHVIHEILNLPNRWKKPEDKDLL